MDLLKENNCYISGGCITSIITNKPVNDIDIYFSSREGLLEVVRCFKDENPHCAFISDKSVTYKLDSDTEVQFIYYDFYKTPKSIFKHFDYTINMAAIDIAKNKLVVDDRFFLHNSQRYLDFNPKTKFPMISALRIQKYKERGYKITRSQYMKIMMAVNKLKLKSWEDFSSAVGNLYGLNFVDKGKMVGKFSLDKAFELIENTDFDGESITEYKYPLNLIDLVLSGETVKYAKLPNGETICSYDEDGVEDLIEKGVVKSENVSVKELLGKTLYKWVRQDLGSIHHHPFKYELNKEVVAVKKGYVHRDPVLYFPNQQEVLDHSFGRTENRVIIECEYSEEDIRNVGSYEIEITKVTPIKVLTKEEFKKIQEEKTNG